MLGAAWDGMGPMMFSTCLLYMCVLLVGVSVAMSVAMSSGRLILLETFGSSVTKMAMLESH